VKENLDKTYNGMKQVAEGAWDLGVEAVKELQASLSDLVPESNETDVLYKEYCSEDLKTVFGDINESLDELDLPEDSGIISGTFVVTVKHINE